MNKLTTFSLVFLLLVLGVSCTEEISDELKNTDQAASESSATKAVGNKIKLVHKMDESLSYHLHSTKGRSYPCELEASGSNFSSTTYEKSDSKDVVDCILEVEELDLYFEGVEYELQVDEYLCEYVQYKPFKYFKYPVGYTTQKQYQVVCDSACSSAIGGETFCANIEGTYLTYDGASRITSTSAITGEFTNQTQASCKYDYSEVNGPNCDPGKITTYTYNILPEERNECVGDGPGVSARTSEADCELAGTWGYCSDGVSADEATCLAVPAVWSTACTVAGRGTEEACTASGSWDLVAYCGTTNITGAGYDNQIIIDSDPPDIDDCGGETKNCLDGPSIEQIGEDYISEIYDNKDLSSFVKSWEISKSIGERASNRYAANYSRICSNNQTKASYYDNVLTSATGLLGHEVETHTPSPRKPFDGTDPTQVYQSETIDYNNDGNDDYVVLADHPFKGVLGVGGVARKTVMPYYGFYCLDKARDVKAQIRLFIREWDRMYEKDSSKMEYVSDFDDPSDSTRLIDNDNYYDDDHPWNNFGDWDDFFDSKFTGDKCGELVDQVNPGECWKDTGDAEGACTGAGKLWVDKQATCYGQLAGAASDQSGRKACEDEASDQKWIYGITTKSYLYNFPWSGI
jgi:hypothetical protein